MVNAYGEDLTTACVRGLAAAEAARTPVLVQWGEVSFRLAPGLSLQQAHRAFFAAAAELRGIRERAAYEEKLSRRIVDAANQEAIARSAAR